MPKGLLGDNATENRSSDPTATPAITSATMHALANRFGVWVLDLMLLDVIDELPNRRRNKPKSTAPEQETGVKIDLRSEWNKNKILELLRDGKRTVNSDPKAGLNQTGANQERV